MKTLAFFLLSLFSFSPFTPQLPMDAASKKTFVLIHGAFASKNAWDKVKPAFEKAGHKVVVFDLPAHGDDATPIKEATFDAYVNKALQMVNAEPGKVVLVGHSMAGMVISAVAEKAPAKIDKLVYLSAYLPKNGDDLQTLSSTDAQSLIGPNLKFAADYSGASLPNEIAEKVFAGDCSEDIKQMVVSHNKIEPLGAFQAKIVLSDANFGKIPKYYIETLKDQGVGTALQERMIAANGHIAHVYKIDSGHTPYFAKPEELSKILIGLN